LLSWENVGSVARSTLKFKIMHCPTRYQVITTP
jgi:hypothetical protein